MFTPSIDCVYVLPVLSFFVFVHAKYWLCISVTRLEILCACSRLELFCACSHLVLIVYMCCPSWVILCLVKPSIDCVYALPVLSYFVFVHAKYWLCICVARLELCCVCSRLVLIVYMCCPSWVILCFFTRSIDCVYVFPVLSYFVFFHAKYWLCICVARIELFCVCSRQILIVYICYSSWVIMRLFTRSIDCVYVFPVLSYFVFFHANYWLYMCCPSFLCLHSWVSCSSLLCAHFSDLVLFVLLSILFVSVMCSRFWLSFICTVEYPVHLCYVHSFLTWFCADVFNRTINDNRNR